MNQATIKLIFSLILIYPVSRLLYKYIFHVFIPYMLNQKYNWNKCIEKPRLLFYIVFGGIAYGCWLALQNYPYSGRYYFDLLVQILFLSILTISSLLLHFTWTRKFSSKLIPMARDISMKINRVQLESIVKDDKSISELHYSLENYVSCDIEALTHFIHLTPLGKTKKIRWIDTGGNNNTDSNQQSLLAFIITIFPGLKRKNKVQRKKVKEIAEKYFCDNTGNPITINPPTFDLYRRTEKNQPKLEIRKLISQFKNG